MQKGYTSQGIIFLIVLVGITAFYLGTQYQNPRQTTQTNNQNISTESANLNENAQLNVSSPTDAKIAELKSQPNDDSMIISKGVFQYSENKINYTFSFPKDGGDVNGKLEGVCDGVLTGTYNGGTKNSLSGNFEGKCTAGPILFIKPTVKATYTGDVDKEKGKIYIRYNMTEPSSYLGSFELDIQK